MKKSKGMQLGAMLAAMLLVGMAFVPAVSAKADDGKQNLSPIFAGRLTVIIKYI